MSEYQPVRPYITTSNDPHTGAVTAWHTYYESYLPRFASRHNAIRTGLREWGHDDFQIAVWSGDKLTSVDWMREVVESDPETLDRIRVALEDHEASS